MEGKQTEEGRKAERSGVIVDEVRWILWERVLVSSRGRGCKVGGCRRDLGYTEIRWSGRTLGIVKVDGKKEQERAEKGSPRSEGQFS